jgi:hypothetical protein
MLQGFRGSVFGVLVGSPGALRAAGDPIAPRRIEERLDYWPFMLGLKPAPEASPNPSS